MNETKDKVLHTFEKVLPELSELEQERLLYFGEGIAFKAAENRKNERQNQDQPRKTG